MNERCQEAKNLRDSGMTFREIGERLGGISVERARQIVRQANRPPRAPSWTDGLSSMTANALRGVGFQNKEELIDVVDRIRSSTGDTLWWADPFTGKMEKIPDGNFRIPGIGVKGIKEIRSWLGLPPIVKKPNPAYIEKSIKFLEKHGYTVTKS